MNDKQNDNRIFAYLILIAVLLAILCAVAAIALLVTRVSLPSPKTTTRETTPTQKTVEEVLLPSTGDAGTAYLDKMIFFGESTTAHLRSRGVLTGGTSTKQVWSDESNTKTLSSRLLSETIVYPRTGKNLTLAEALEEERPAYLVLAFGLNNLFGFIENKDLYVSSYCALIDLVKETSPGTRIILQTVYPVAGDCDQFSADADTVNRNIKTLNGWVAEIACRYDDVRVADTASVVTDSSGALAVDYADEADGYHLTTAAYRKILMYLRNHAWTD